ncbi:hypothetical protein [Breznakia pachnodae]|uniref:ATP-binding protein n=1 Tax=Breznakia pachnodae TaxID=265178 RepID=A0ABU0E6F2_9FIRM|nr:hypothetical protein [Breznakia pachnodae]MDQ0362467.1 hypothetical protein [Breznakia pachnodae]
MKKVIKDEDVKWTFQDIAVDDLAEDEQYERGYRFMRGKRGSGKTKFMREVLNKLHVQENLKALIYSAKNDYENLKGTHTFHYTRPYNKENDLLTLLKREDLYLYDYLIIDEFLFYIKDLEEFTELHKYLSSYKKLTVFLIAEDFWKVIDFEKKSAYTINDRFSNKTPQQWIEKRMKE